MTPTVTVKDPIKGYLHECKSCGGRYYPDVHGGYYHACPPSTGDPRNENIDDSDPKNIRIKAEGKGRKLVMVEEGLL